MSKHGDDGSKMAPRTPDAQSRSEGAGDASSENAQASEDELAPPSERVPHNVLVEKCLGHIAERVKASKLGNESIMRADDDDFEDFGIPLEEGRRLREGLRRASKAPSPADLPSRPPSQPEPDSESEREQLVEPEPEPEPPARSGSGLWSLASGVTSALGQLRPTTEANTATTEVVEEPEGTQPALEMAQAAQDTRVQMLQESAATDEDELPGPEEEGAVGVEAGIDEKPAEDSDSEPEPELEPEAPHSLWHSLRTSGKLWASTKQREPELEPEPDQDEDEEQQIARP